MLVITETTVKPLGKAGAQCAGTGQTITQQHSVLLAFLQVAIPQRLVETHDYFKIHPTRHD